MNWKPENTGESYDLSVVGAGISGLAAAHFYRQSARGRVLILENHDDVGGHAKRNEFISASGRRLIGYGGSQIMIGSMTIGGIMAFVSYLTFMMWPIQDFARVYAEMQHSIASA